MPAEPEAGVGPGARTGPGSVTRIGLALVAPRWALALADRPDHPGRSGSDLIRMLGALLVSVHLRRLIAAVWLAVAIGITAGLRGLVATLSQALTVDLAFLVVATAILWLAAGSRRSLGRAFDQVCVAALPLIAVEVVATAVVRGLDLQLDSTAMLAVAGVAYGWAGAIVALGWRQIRRAPPVEVPVPRAQVRRGTWAGAALLAAAAAVLAINTAWAIRNRDLLRPMVAGDRAPAFALPSIGPDGTLGAPVSLDAARGKIVIVDFWATWCDPCIKWMPHVAQLGRELGADGQVILVNLDNPRQARVIADKVAPGVALVYDTAGVRDRYQVGPLPRTVVIDRAGMIRAATEGAGPNEIGVIGRAIAAAR